MLSGSYLSLIIYKLFVYIILLGSGGDNFPYGKDYYVVQYVLQ